MLVNRSIGKIATTAIDNFRNVFQLMNISCANTLVTSDVIHLLSQMLFLRLELTLHTLDVARSGKPPASFAGIKSKLLLTRVCMKFEFITKVPYLNSTEVYGLIHSSQNLRDLMHYLLGKHCDQKRKINN